MGREEHGCLVNRVRTGPQTLGGHFLLTLAYEQIGRGAVEDKEDTIEKTLHAHCGEVHGDELRDLGILACGHGCWPGRRAGGGSNIRERSRCSTAMLYK